MGMRVYGEHMGPVPEQEWPIMPGMETEPLMVWESRDYLAVLYQQKANGWKRLTVNSVRRNGKSWRDGIIWDELQRIKNECLGPETWCVENYPSDSKLVDVSNMRHLFVLDEPPEFRFPEKSVFSTGTFEMRRMR